MQASLSPEIYRTQVDGLAAALDDPEIAAELDLARAALALMQSTGARLQDVSIPWIRIGRPQDVAAFGVAVGNTSRA